MSPPKRRLRSLLVNLLLAGCAAAVGLALIEGAIRGLDLMADQRAIATGTDSAYRTGPAARDEANADRPVSRWVLHPYRGVTPRPLQETMEVAGNIARHNAFGILSEVEDPRTDLAEEDLVIGIFGGSVARSVGRHGRAVIAEAVAESLGDAAPRVRVVNFALSGYKQPQQTFELAELLLLGVPIDVVVNIDGYNEMALALSDAQKGHHPLYPHWGFWNSAIGFGAGTLSIAKIEKTADAVRLRRRADRWRAWIRESPWGRLATVQAVYGKRIAEADAAAVLAERAIRKTTGRQPAEDQFRLGAPCLGQEDEAACLDLVADLWRRSSSLMAATAENFGALYLHALQPNQYVEGSKRLTDQERRVAWNPEREWSRMAILGYPRLRETGALLVEEGIAFHDLTQVFADRDETIYTDTCCHFNPLGAQLVGAEIGRHVAALLAAQAESD